MSEDSRIRLWLTNAAVLIGASLACLVVFEVGLRIFYGNPHVFRSPQVRHVATSYGYKPEPNQTASYTLDKLVTTNSHGFRDTKEWTVPKPVGWSRVLILGDSFTFGNGVSTEERFSNLLEADLQASEPQVDVLNASAGGWNLDNEYFFVKAEGLSLEPDVLLLVFFINDWMSPPPPGGSDSVSPAILSPEGRWDARPSWLRWLPYEWIYKLKYSAAVMYLRDKIAVWRSGPDLNTRLLMNEIDLDAEPLVSYSYEKLAELKRICEERGIEMVIALMPPVNFFWLSGDKPSYVSHFERFASSESITFVDLSENLATSPGEGSLYNYPWDNHLNPEGHRRVADQLRPVVERLLRLAQTEAGGLSEPGASAAGGPRSPR